MSEEGLRLDLLLAQARAHLQQRERQAAWGVLQQAHAIAPDDYRVWLLMAQTVTDGQKRAQFIRQAERLAPEATAVQKAVAWLAQNPPPTQPTNPQPTPAKRNWLLPTAVFLLLLLLAIFFGGFALQQNWLAAAPANQAIAAVTEPESPSPTNTPTVLPTATATATPTPFFLLPNSLVQPVVTATAVQIAMAQSDIAAKPIAQRQSDEAPRPTWTPTPVPTNTPTPTPSPQPTFVADGGPIMPASILPGEKWIDVNLTTQILRAYEGDKLVLETPISSGRPPYYTVTGQFRIYLRYDMQTMDGRSLGFDYVTSDVPHVQYFYGNFALHGAYWHNNFGTPVSHGCVNLNLTDAAWLYQWATYGTLVNVHY
jgi:lipoprotein-anchoring transpeptidase ErfK/SrfK